MLIMICLSVRINVCNTFCQSLWTPSYALKDTIFWQKRPKTIAIGIIVQDNNNSNLFTWPSMWTRLVHAHCLETINNMWFLGKREWKTIEKRRKKHARLTYQAKYLPLQHEFGRVALPWVRSNGTDLHKMKINTELCCKRYDFLTKKDPKLSLSELLSRITRIQIYS
jgi:hypothetical protein